MKIQDKDAWQTLIYQLLYPGILGSMLYSLLEYRFERFSLYVAEILVVIFYCLDYLHLYMDLKVHKRESATAWQMVFDTVFAVLIGAAYWRLAQNHFDQSVYFLLTVFILLCLYPTPSGKYRKKQYYSTTVIMLVLLAGTFLVKKLIADTDWFIPLVYGVPIAWYAFHIFHITPRLSKPSVK